MKKHLLIICGLFLCTSISGQSENSSLTYHVELGATAGNGTYAPLWFTGNRYGLGSTNPTRDICWQESHTKNNSNADGVLKPD